MEQRFIVSGLELVGADIGYEFTNVIGTIRLLDFCRRMEVPTFILASSSSVYGPDTPPPAREDHPADVPETLASLERVGLELGWVPTVFFPDAPVVAETGTLERSPDTFSG